MPLPVSHALTRPVPPPLPLAQTFLPLVQTVRGTEDRDSCLAAGEQLLLSVSQEHPQMRAAKHRSRPKAISVEESRPIENSPTEILADAALAKCQLLLSKAGLALACDDRQDHSPSSNGTGKTSWRSTSCSESEDENWRNEYEHTSDVSVQGLEDELCMRLGRIEEELRLVRQLGELACSSNSQTSTPCARAPSQGSVTSTSPSSPTRSLLALTEVCLPCATRTRSPPKRCFVGAAPGLPCPVCKQANFVSCGSLQSRRRSVP